ncbi:histidine kinase [Sphingomonas gilva]|uniref:Histidine kinase n=1 Tax=Sphingomonas gilva TaxID=2305907 RepID=A0A396RPA9_9SPHN|nr:histidine kinase [Sphingomonas gilva]RHW17072.1 histidine kinase [Sphingomonas gilva]
MWRFLAGALSAMLLMGAGLVLWNSQAASEQAIPDPPPPPPAAATARPLPETVPAATAKTREERRFDRYDRDRNGAITREEYLRQRRKAYAKLDTNGDGRLGFEEWAIRTTTKFATADGDKSGAMSRTEFATTAVKRRAPARRDCPPVESDG